MNTLRARIAALLVAAIVGVVGLASLVASNLLRPPLPEATIEPVARQIRLLAGLVVHDRGAAERAGADIRPGPDTGAPDPDTTRFLTHALERTGEALPVAVTRSAEAPVALASVDLGETGWLVVELPDVRPPDSAWRILAVWVSLIVAGSTSVAIYAAWRLTRPLELLRRAVSHVGADGVLEPIPESGSAEVRATARALNDLSARLKGAMHSRMRLVAAAGHDLRTPMTRLRLRVEFLADDDERARWLKDLDELERIADSAIRLVREEAGGDTAEVIRLDLLLREVAEELAGIGHAVEYGALPETRVQAGPLALKRALSNLIANAAKHGGGAQIALRKDQGLAIVAITDNGPGIPEALIPRVFEPFFRVDPARRQSVPGAGLGLAIAQEIIERTGGRIVIANRAPQGLVQTVWLNLAEEAGAEPAARPVGRQRMA